MTQIGVPVPLGQTPSQQLEIINFDQQFLNFASFHPDLAGAQAAPDTKTKIAETRIYDKRELQTKTINLRQIDFWFKQAGIFCDELSMTDTGLVYSKFQVKGITYLDFLTMLEDLTIEKEITTEDIKFKLQTCGMPGASKSAKAAPTNV